MQKFDKEFFASEQYDKEKSIKLNLEDIICDEELANIKCKTYFLKQKESKERQEKRQKESKERQKEQKNEQRSHHYTC